MQYKGLGGTAPLDLMRKTTNLLSPLFRPFHGTHLLNWKGSRKKNRLVLSVKKGFSLKTLICHLTMLIVCGLIPWMGKGPLKVIYQILDLF